MTIRKGRMLNENDGIEDRYARAKLFIEGYLNNSLVQNDTLLPTWIEGTNKFWYVRDVGVTGKGLVGKNYRIVDINNATNDEAFDHAILAASLASATGRAINRYKLPISHLEIQFSPFLVFFNAFDQRWKFDGSLQSCNPVRLQLNVSEALSPDKEKLAFSRDYNIWVVDVRTGEETQLTNDGEEDYAYGVRTSAPGMRFSPEVPGLWSKDSRRFLTVLRDKRKVLTFPMVDHVPADSSVRPILSVSKVAYPGDKEIETYLPICIDIPSRAVRRPSVNPIPSCDYETAGIFRNNLLWWADDSRYSYFVNQERGNKLLRLTEFDTDSGNIRHLFQEFSDTYVNLSHDVIGFSLHRVLPKTNELVWWSERDGWGHLYLYDLLSGRLKHRITRGDWVIRDVLFVDEASRDIWVQTSGRISSKDAYYRDVCRINIDSGDMTTILDGDFETIVHCSASWPVLFASEAGLACNKTNGISPNGDYFVATLTRANKPSRTKLFNKNGLEILHLETTQTSTLPAGWRWPEPFITQAANNEDELYGLLFKPSSFSADKQYPVINFIHASPWLSAVPKGSFHSSRGYTDRHYFYSAALAELGFIVVLIDSRGTPLRSKSFRDVSYGWIPSSANQADHISTLRQLAARYPFMDLSRVGIFATAYRSGLQSFLENQNFYKVCVQMGLIDNRLTGGLESEPYEGVNGPDKSQVYPEQLVGKLKGKLLLMHAMTSVLSPCYPVSGLFRMVQALQKANKDFDMLVVPDGGFLCNSYMFRRGWDYLVKHLKGIEPPREFCLEDVNMTNTVDHIDG